MSTTLGTFGVPVSDTEEAFLSQLLFPLQLAGPISPDFTPVNPAQRGHKYDQGVAIVVQILGSDGKPLPIRAATTKTIYLVKPAGQSIGVAAALFTNGYDGKMYFTTTSVLPAGAGLDQAGLWYIQGKVTISGETQFTEWGCFLAAPNLGV